MRVNVEAQPVSKPILTVKRMSLLIKVSVLFPSSAFYILHLLEGRCLLGETGSTSAGSNQRVPKPTDKWGRDNVPATVEIVPQREGDRNIAYGRRR